MANCGEPGYSDYFPQDEYNEPEFCRDHLKEVVETIDELGIEGLEDEFLADPIPLEETNTPSP